MKPQAMKNMNDYEATENVASENGIAKELLSLEAQVKPLSENQKNKIVSIFNHYAKKNEFIEDINNLIGYFEVDGSKIQFIDRSNKSLVGRSDIINNDFIFPMNELGDITPHQFVNYINKNILFSPAEYDTDEFWKLRESGKISYYNISEYKNYKRFVLTFIEQSLSEDKTNDHLFKNIDDVLKIVSKEEIAPILHKTLKSQSIKSPRSLLYDMKNYLNIISTEEMNIYACVVLDKMPQEKPGLVIDEIPSLLKVIEKEELEPYILEALENMGESSNRAFRQNIKDLEKVLTKDNLKIYVHNKFNNDLSKKNTSFIENLAVYNEFYGKKKLMTHVTKILKESDDPLFLAYRFYKEINSILSKEDIKNNVLDGFKKYDTRIYSSDFSMDRLIDRLGFTELEMKPYAKRAAENLAIKEPRMFIYHAKYYHKYISANEIRTIFLKNEDVILRDREFFLKDMNRESREYYGNALRKFKVKFFNEEDEKE